jgi:hypothetical protein
MGCWGTRIFDNDTAADWAHDLAKAKDLWFIEKTIERVLDFGDESLDSRLAEKALAAAEAKDLARIEKYHRAWRALTR